TVAAPSLDVAVRADPEQAPIGTQVTFTATVTNRGTSAVTGLVIVERYDAGLRHTQVAANPIEADVGTLAPGQSKSIPAPFFVTASIMHFVTVGAVGRVGVR